jgi:hypothetical protein
MSGDSMRLRVPRRSGFYRGERVSTERMTAIRFEPSRPSGAVDYASACTRGKDSDTILVQPTATLRIYGVDFFKLSPGKSNAVALLHADW